MAANLRYHVDRADARVRGRIEVTQRLKRHDTLIGKLARERGNVTQMQDIGGVRAVLPSQRHEWRFAGADYDRKATKWRCPTNECATKSKWVKTDRLHADATWYRRWDSVSRHR